MKRDGWTKLVFDHLRIRCSFFRLAVSPQTPSEGARGEMRGGKDAVFQRLELGACSWEAMTSCRCSPLNPRLSPLLFTNARTGSAVIYLFLQQLQRSDSRAACFWGSGAGSCASILPIYHSLFITLTFSLANSLKNHWRILLGELFFEHLTSDSVHLLSYHRLIQLDVPLPSIPLLSPV